MEKIVKNEEFLSSKKEEIIAIEQLFGALLVVPVMILISWSV